jgi:extradiol dioxygenase family protein
MAKYICPLVVVTDIIKAKQFYGQVLGQEIKYDFGENVAFHGDFAIHDEKHFSELIENKTIVRKSNSFELYFEDDEFEQLADTLKEIGVEFIHDVKIQPWQQKVIRFYDMDKNVVEVGESMEHVCKRLSSEGTSIEEISKLTSMPSEFVRKTLNTAGKQKK